MRKRWPAILPGGGVIRTAGCRRRLPSARALNANGAGVVPGPVGAPTAGGGYFFWRAAISFSSSSSAELPGAAPSFFSSPGLPVK
jgi:hypothetical protein